MALTNDESLMEKMSLLRSHGITRNPSEMTHEPDGPWYYQQTDLGYNYRMTDVQAALGLSQVSRLDEYVKRRNVLAERYDGLLAGFPLDTPWQHPDCYSSYHLYVIRLNLDAMGASHREVFEFMRKEGIGVNLHYIPIYTQPWYRNRTSIHGPFPEAEKYYREAITLPLFPKMTFEQQDAVIDALSRAVNQ
jgi:dTDP-4-amino-4,6-dideoxygalactose transaminase